jgi:uncharacterized protein YutE (UPF0331/DUF86 family)
VSGDAIVKERLQYLRNQVNYLKAERSGLRTFDQYASDMRLRKAVERTLQVAVEACLDIARRIIALEGYRYPADNRDTFRVLMEERILPQPLLDPLSDMAGFRNLIVHDYAKIDDEIVYGILKKRLGDFDAYAETIRIYLTGD